MIKFDKNKLHYYLAQESVLQWFHPNASLQEILVSTDEEDPGKIPIIFLKDISYVELDCMIQYIYTGKAVLPDGFNLASFTELAKTLGVSGNFEYRCYIILPKYT